ncbi:MAG TPA: cupin [Streptomyces sp.]|nr:cupin [Streptomyces sp.]
MTTTARATVQHEDERVRVTRWDFEPGASTGRHVHDHDYVVVPLTDGTTGIRTPDGTETPSQLRAGESYARPAGAEHEVVNTGSSWLAFVEIELKEPAATAPA